MVLYDGRVLVQPTVQELTRALGGPTEPGSGTYDVVIIGAGPAGLAAAVYAGSEGLPRGATYRRLDVPGMDPLVDAGVFYGNAVTDMQALHGADVYVVGAGNSAGQAAAHLAAAGARVGLLVRRDSLNATMPDYLIREITGSANVEVLFNTQVRV